jgi:quercetin dioxygenase-like cupin family protein
MLSRRNFGACAICAIAGFAAMEVGAQAAAPGFKRTILKKTDLSDKYVAVLVAVDLEPGAIVARHTHPGIESGYCVEGGLELSAKGEPTQKVTVGTGFQVPAEVPHSALVGDKTTRVIATYVVEKDKPLASPAPE